MPTIIRFNNCHINIHFDDHNPPHFHIYGSDFRVMVNIETLQIMEGSAAKANIREAMEWAKDNKATLRDAWAKYTGK
ncbi:DUF4160 domain-containing protein [Desulfovibrio subterraneus]|uniref:DUF4160 domain-containing protein n=1 Tax=Desulfovibrio subterraneus TaxID=2718620 RepID=UPI0022B887B9|nr:DUF4160 domain-containing protein [Desulfovibrio subterraneus]WBF67587.1 DUF4160 domain-containing protein [Desulfovibrio subterraneus]